MATKTPAWDLVPHWNREKGSDERIKPEILKRLEEAAEEDSDEKDE